MILDNFEKKIISWIKKEYKYITIIFMYALFQSGYLISLFNLYKLKGKLRILSFALTDILYVLIIIVLLRKEIYKGIKDLKKNFSKRLELSLKCWFIGSIIMIVSSLLIGLISKSNISENEKSVRELIKIAPFYMLLSCSIIAPIFEESVFRISLHGLIKNKWIFIILSGFIFGLVHITGDNPNIIDFLYIIPYGSMGACFAYLLYKTDNITLPIIVHMIHNTLLVLPKIIGGLM